MKKLLPIAILISLSSLIVLFMPPSNLLIILILIAFVSMAVGLIFKLFTPHKAAVLASVICFLAFTVKALDLFDPLNIALAISLLVGVAILIK